MTSPKGISLHIGLNWLDASHYEGLWELEACEADALVMAQLAKEQGFSSQVLLSDQATRHAVTDAIIAASQALMPGDIFFVSFAGHGGQVPASIGSQGEEKDGYDETWCLFDGQLLDNELAALWQEFEEGVRILLVSDSCHSGTVSQCIFEKFLQGESEERYTHYRYMPRSLSFSISEGNKEFYEGIRSEVEEKRFDIKASVFLIAACQDTQFAQEQNGHGVFTRALLQVWQHGAFQGDYKDLFKELHQVIQGLGIPQVPNFTSMGAGTSAFVNNRPFSI